MSTGSDVRRGDGVTLCPAWCTRHEGDPSDNHPEADSWHTTSYLRVAGTALNMSTGTYSRSPRIFGLHAAGSGGEDDGESVSLVEAEELAWILLGMVAAGKREEDR